MFQTKKQLLKEIVSLKAQLAEAKAKEMGSGIVSERKLPKCESIACAACRKAIIRENAYGWYTVLGCGKNLACADYDPIIQPFAERKTAIQRDLQARQM